MNEDNNNLFEEYKKLVKLLEYLEKDSRESPIPSLEGVSYIFERNARIIAKRLLNDYLSGNCRDSSFISQCAYELTSAFSLGWVAHSSNKFADIPTKVESCEVTNPQLWFIPGAIKYCQMTETVLRATNVIPDGYRLRVDMNEMVIFSHNSIEVYVFLNPDNILKNPIFIADGKEIPLGTRGGFVKQLSNLLLEYIESKKKTLTSELLWLNSGH